MILFLLGKNPGVICLFPAGKEKRVFTKESTNFCKGAVIILMLIQLYSFYFLGFFYSFRHWLLILLVLTIVTYLLSVLIEKAKLLTGYAAFMKKWEEI